jgi:hypothetical protein
LDVKQPQQATGLPLIHTEWAAGRSFRYPLLALLLTRNLEGARHRLAKLLLI